MNGRVVALAALALAGCSTPDPGIRVETVRVNVPVACVDRADLPAVPDRLAARPSDARAALDLAVAKLVELLGPKLDGQGGYVGKSQAIMRGCLR